MECTMWLKFHAWIYRRTGYVTDYAKARMYEALNKEIVKINKDYVFLSVYLGTWQAKHGFYRTSEQVKKDMDKRWKRKKWKR